MKEKGGLLAAVVLAAMALYLGFRLGPTAPYFAAPDIPAEQVKTSPPPPPLDLDEVSVVVAGPRRVPIGDPLPIAEPEIPAGAPSLHVLRWPTSSLRITATTASRARCSARSRASPSPAART